MALAITYNSNTDTIATGKITTGTAVASIYVDCGFVPTYVCCTNVSTDGKCKVEWFKGMTDAYAIKTATDGTISILTSLGITPSGVTGSYLGFTLGADTDIGAINEEVYFLALG